MKPDERDAAYRWDMLDEARENLREAVELVIEANRQLSLNSSSKASQSSASASSPLQATSLRGSRPFDGCLGRTPRVEVASEQVLQRAVIGGVPEDARDPGTA